MEEHKHTIAEVYRLAEVLEGKAPKNHTHEGYATADHKHTQYAAKNHAHKDYATADHTHPELEEAIRRLQPQGNGILIHSGETLTLDTLQDGTQAICTFTGNRPTHIRDYFQSAGAVVFNTQNILIAPGKRFAVRIIRTTAETVILFDGMLNTL